MEKEIGRIEKNTDVDIVLMVNDFGGRRGLNIREFVDGQRYKGFTKAGVRISTQNWKKFKEMINSIEDKDMEEPEEQ